MGSRVRAAFAGLTTRGRAFVAAGVAAGLCAIVLGQKDLLRVAILVIALPVVSALVVARTRYRVASQRRVEPMRVPAGVPGRVRLRVENVSRLPTGLLLLEDDIPYLLGSRPRFVVDRVEPRGIREVSYPIRSDVRGVFTVGPLTVRLSDPFGLCELPRSFTSRTRFIVTPAVYALPQVPLGGEWSGSGDSRSRSIAAAGEDDIATREYRHGDDLRRVHWRTTARQGQIMVRREEQPWQSRATVLLDTRSGAHIGDGPASSFEWAISAAASTAVHLLRRGYAVRLVTDTGAVIGGGTEGNITIGDVEGMILDALAIVTPSRNISLRQAAPGLRRGGGEGLLVAVLGALDAGEVTALARLRHGTTTAIGVLLDTAAWSTRGHDRGAGGRVDFDNATILLRRSGWRILTAGPEDTLPRLWPRVAYVGLDADPAQVELAASGERPRPNSDISPGSPRWRRC
jgi:uncharacterized protein (DUF58 family)